MLAEALILAALLNRPPELVNAIYEMSGLDGVAVVECESQFNPRAIRAEPRGHTSWGLWQIDDEWHEQYRTDLLLHIANGAGILAECKTKTPDFARAVAIYNGGNRPPWKSIEWGEMVQRKRDSLALYLWRHLR